MYVYMHVCMNVCMCNVHVGMCVRSCLLTHLFAIHVHIATILAMMNMTATGTDTMLAITVIPTKKVFHTYI